MTVCFLALWSVLLFRLALSLWAGKISCQLMLHGKRPHALTMGWGTLPHTSRPRSDGVIQLVQVFFNSFWPAKRERCRAETLPASWGRTNGQNSTKFGLWTRGHLVRPPLGGFWPEAAGSAGAGVFMKRTLTTSVGRTGRPNSTKFWQKAWINFVHAWFKGFSPEPNRYGGIKCWSFCFVPSKRLRQFSWNSLHK